MADNYLITGYHGAPHVTAENDRGIHAGIFGAGRFVLPVGRQFKAEYIGNNTIRMYDGKLMDNGAAAGIPVSEYIDLPIANAGQGMKRNDLIVFQYSKDTSTMIESGSFAVVQGAETSGSASDPSLTQSDLLGGTAILDQMPLWRVSVVGTAISAPVQLFRVSSTLDAANVTPEQIGAADRNHTHTPASIGAADADHTHTAADVGAADVDHTHTAEDVGAASADHTHTLESLNIIYSDTEPAVINGGIWLQPI